MTDTLDAELTAPGQLFEMEQIEVRGAPLRAWRYAPPNLPTVLEQSRGHGDKLFLVYEDERSTFEEHFRRAATMAHRLIDEFGVGKGDRVAIAMRNYPEWVEAFWAAAAAGAVVVPLNAWWTGAELAYGVSDSGTKVLFADQARVDALADLLPEVEAIIVARADGDLPAGQRHFADVLGDVAADVTLPGVVVEPDDDATIFYTSGTTGRPKGALGTHRNICTNVMSLAFGFFRSAKRSGGEVPDLTGSTQEATLLSVPLFHVTGCHAMMLGSTAFGGKLVMMHKWDAERALELIERERITGFGGVPSMVWEVLESPSFATRDVSSVKSIGYGGAPAPPELVRRKTSSSRGGPPATVSA